MEILRPSSLLAVVTSGLAIALLSASTVGCTVAAPGYGYDYPIYGGDGDYDRVSYKRVSQQLRNNLRRKGYQVMDIRADSHRGRRALIAYAKKNNQAYELKYSYPDLRLISSNKKSWSNIWDDEDHHKNDKYKKDKYKNHGKYNKHYKGDDVEDRIKQESRYPAIKQRAIRKVGAMGYRVKDIELEEKNNRGVFEIEAKRGSQEYEILLGYPNLNVIKIEKD